MKWNQLAWVLAFILGAGITGGSVRAGAPPLAQDRSHDQDNRDNRSQEQDYSKNQKYQQGLRDGKDDLTHNRDHSKKRHFKKDEDQKAYEYGYQEGHRGEHEH
jgi:hypothetical protein